jgi:serine/threonine protein phosphatase PrpC
MNVAVDAYHQSLNKHQEELCGDRVVLTFTNHSYICVLADGLGSGVKANILATLTATILNELLISDVGLDEAIETLTATLPECQERKIAYSTFSVLKIDDDGSSTIIEFDNPKAIVIADNKQVYLERQEKKYQNRTVYLSYCQLKPNDYVVLVSDGVIHAGLGHTLNFGWQRQDVVKHLIANYDSKHNAQMIGNNLIDTVEKLYDHQPKDDATIVVSKIIARHRSVVMVGPPKDMTQDQLKVLTLNNATGKKIVCGGTTAQIVAKNLQKRIAMDDSLSTNNDLPPTATIEGLDLVTEGILTLGRVVDLLVEASTNKNQKDRLCSSVPVDGAHRLVQLLLNDCTEILFLVGLADNPAHSQLAHALSVNMKSRLVARIATYLKMFGKIVTIIEA